MKSPFLIKLVSYLAVAIFWLLHFTLRYRYHGVENLEAADSKTKGHLLCFWHKNILACTFAQKRHSHVVMASRSPTADPMVMVAKSFGHVMVRGSSSKGGRDKGGQVAKAEIIEKLKEGRNGAVAADGPSGPAFQAKIGIIDMAVATGYAIVPYCAVPKRYVQVNSWDQMLIPKPFTQIDVYYGEPIFVPANTTKDDYGTIVEQLNCATTALGSIKP